jgi:hypothetical protein
MARKRFKPEEIVAKLRQVEVLTILSVMCWLISNRSLVTAVPLCLRAARLRPREAKGTGTIG